MRAEDTDATVAPKSNLVRLLVLMVGFWIVLCVIVLYSKDAAIKAVGFPFRGALVTTRQNAAAEAKLASPVPFFCGHYSAVLGTEHQCGAKSSAQ